MDNISELFRTTGNRRITRMTSGRQAKLERLKTSCIRSGGKRGTARNIGTNSKPWRDAGKSRDMRLFEKSEGRRGAYEDAWNNWGEVGSMGDISETGGNDEETKKPGETWET